MTVMKAIIKDGEIEIVPMDETDLAMRSRDMMEVPVPLMPETVSRFQIHEALRETPSPVEGFADAYEAVASLVRQIGGRTERAFFEAITFDRSSPAVNGAAVHFGKDGAWVDDLFRRAGAISA